MLVKTEDHHRQIPPTCPICDAPMVITPAVQFRYAAGIDKVVYDCEKCQTFSTFMIDWGQSSCIARPPFR